MRTLGFARHRIMRAVKFPYAVLVPVGIMVSGCNVRPPLLAEDGTELRVFDVIHRIQCEAAEAVRKKHPNFSLSAGLKKLLDNIGDKQKTLNDKRKELSAKSDFGTREEELKEAAASYFLMDAQIEQARARIEGTKKGEEKRLALEALLKEELRLDAQLQHIAAMTTIFKEILEKNTELEEMRKGLKDFKSIILFEKNTAAFQFEFLITEDNNVSSTASAVWPITLGAFVGTFTLGYDVGDKRQRLAERKVKLISSFGELVRFKCEGISSSDRLRRLPGRYPMTGNIGLEEVILDYILYKEDEAGKFKTGGESYTDKIQFTTTVNGSIKPGIDIARKPGPTVKASAVLDGSRKDVHQLTIFLAPPGGDDKSDAVQQVVITQMPAVRVRTEILRLPPLN